MRGPGWDVCQVRQTETSCRLGQAKAGLVILKLKERSWNVYENKGPLWKTLSEAGMLLKTKVVIWLKSVSYLK
jgi:hypothetical protein